MRYNKTQITQIITMRNEGASYQAITDKLGYPSSSVHNVLRRAGLTRKNSKRRRVTQATRPTPTSTPTSDTFALIELIVKSDLHSTKKLAALKALV